MYLTPHYSLVAFTAGDVFQSALDQRRFVIIDNELHFMSNQIGDGVITGWVVTAGAGQNIVVNSGIGMIEQEVTITYGNLDATLKNNQRALIWMQKRNGIIGEFGAFSPMGTVTYTDTTPPANPATPTITSNQFSLIVLDWVANTETDLSGYSIYRSQDNVTFTNLGTTSVNTYSDSTVSATVTYTYKLKAFDVNQNYSGFGATVSVMSAQDYSQPADPTNVQVITGDSRAQVLWNPSISTISSYIVSTQQLNGNSVNIGSPIVTTVPASQTSLIINDLADGYRYSFTVFSRRVSGTLSSGIVVYGTPAANVGPSGVTDIVVSDYPINSTGGVALSISWDIDVDPYIAQELPSYYNISVATVGASPSPSIYGSSPITITKYPIVDTGGTTSTLNVAEETTYNITIQGVDSEGNTESGTFIRYTTHKFTIPGAPTGLTLSGTWSTTAANLAATWTNSASVFSYNLITISRSPLSDPTSQTAIVDGVNIGTANIYQVDDSFLINDANYAFTIIAVDDAGNQSTALQGTTAFSVTTGATGGNGSGFQLAGGSDRPGVPAQQNALGEDFRVVVNWSIYQSNFVQYYNVWRAAYITSDYEASNFSKVATLADDVFTFVDYSVTNGQAYVYFVTVTDIFGNESLNPNDDFFDYALSYALPRNSSTLTQSPAVNVNQNGTDAVLTWTPANDAFDGFEVYRAQGTPYDFVKIGVADADDTSYTDVNGLLYSGTYYYMIRKYLNEGQLLITYTKTAPSGCILIASVVVVQGSIFNIDDTVRTNLANLVDPITAATHAQLMVPHHFYISASDDRRIRLELNLIVTDWVTSDYITYTSQTNMVDVNAYAVYINGLQSTITSSFDSNGGTLTFGQAIYDPSSGAAIPVVTVVCENIQEVVNVLPASYIDPINAVKISRGILDPARIPQLSHFGRYREPLVAPQTILTYTNGYIYSASVPTGVTIYDAMKTQDGNMLASTSVGLQFNNPAESSIWSTILTPAEPITKLYYSDTYDWYIALSGPNVYYSIDGQTFQPIQGLTGVNICRDIAEDDSGNIFISSDAGVQQLNPSAIVKLLWQQTTLPDPQNPSCFAILFSEGTLYVSCGSGLYESIDAGQTWYLADATISVSLFSLFESQGTLFACSATDVWRRTPSDDSFGIIASSVDSLRGLCIYNSVLYAISNQTLVMSTGDIYNDDAIDLGVAFPNLSINGVVPPVYAVSVSSGRLYVGTDNNLYSTDITRSLVLNGYFAGVCPTIYVNGNIRNAGVYYNSGGVYFDQPPAPTDIVSIVTTYQTLQTDNGGWANTNYDAVTFIHLNNVLWAVGQPDTTAQTISNAVHSMVLTSFSARNSNYDVAFATLTNIVQLANAIDQLDPTSSVVTSTITQLFSLVNVFIANIDPSLQATIQMPSIGGNLYQIPAADVTLDVGAFDIVPSSLSNTVGTFDTVGGTVVIQTFIVDKYSKLEISIRDVGITDTGINTHTELDNAVEAADTGLTATLSFIQAGNISRLALFNREQGAPQNGRQLVTTLPTDSNWYDPFRSTVDYNIQSSTATAETFRIPYPADILDLQVNSEVWVCGIGGIIAISTDTLETRAVYQSIFPVYNLQYANNIVYFLAADGLYTIDPATNIVQKNIEITLPPNYSSVFVINDTILIATKTGLYAQRSYDISWTPLLTLNNAVVRSNGIFAFCSGQNPNSTGDAEVYYSAGSSAVWDKSLDFPSSYILGVTQQYDDIYFATNNGLYVEDLAGVFSKGQTIELIDLTGDPDTSATVCVNDVTSDNTRVIAVNSGGNVYIIDADSVVSSTQSSLPSIHKVRIINGFYWLFGFDFVSIENVANVIELSTGRIAS